jgi:hypothetical protein
MQELRNKKALQPESKTLNMEQYLSGNFNLVNKLSKNVYLVSAALYYNRKDATDIVTTQHRLAWSPAGLTPEWLDLERSFNLKAPTGLAVCSFEWEGALTNDYRLQFVQGGELKPGFDETNCAIEKRGWVGPIEFPEKVLLSAKSKKGEIKLLVRLAVLADSLEAGSAVEKPGGQDSPDKNPAPMVMEFKTVSAKP